MEITKKQKPLLDPWEDPNPESRDVAVAAMDTEDTEWEIDWGPTPNGGTSRLSQADIDARKKRIKFLTILSRTGSAKKAAIMSKATHRSLAYARDKYPDFARNWDMALEIYNMFYVEEELRRRAIDGTLEAIYFQGRIVGFKRVYDSGLTQFWTKANMRGKYGERSEVNINANVNHGVAMLPSRAADVDSWEKRSQRTLENQMANMIDITPVVVEDKIVSPQVKMER